MSDTLDIENGLLSFDNPNYHLDPTDVNSNLGSEDDYEGLYEELNAVCRFSRKQTVQSRRQYAQLDPASMGVNVEGESSPLLKADSENNIQEAVIRRSTSVHEKDGYQTIDNNNSDADSNDNQDMGRKSGFLEYYISLEAASRHRKEKETVPSIELVHSSSNLTRTDVSAPCVLQKDKMTISDHTSVDGDKNIRHIQGKVTDDLYAVPHKRNYHHQEDQRSVPLCNISKSHVLDSGNVSLKEPIENESLPSGWEKHEDDCGPYYWHISSGTIQREPPVSSVVNNCKAPNKSSRDIDMISSISDFSLPSYKSSSSSTASVLSEPTHNVSCSYVVDNKLKRRSYPEGSCSLTPDKKPIRFAVRSLGWVEIPEEDLTPERSSKAVNKCIVDLSMGRNDILDVVGRWGDGKDLFMDLDDYCLRLMDTKDLTILNTQPIHTIRVWGVGRDNGRDFAYVARDRVTRKHMCHVFRCDIPARIIANTLRDICKKIMIERSLQHSLAKPVGPGLEKHNGISLCNKGGPIRPNNLPTEQRRFHSDSESSYTANSFPTPMEEPKKVLKVHYLGTINVTKPSGVAILNDAIDQLSNLVPPSEYKLVNVAVAPSTITISELGDEGKQLAECRVRFLSFLGIGRNVKQCGFIVHTAQDQFIAHIFHCEPSSGALCKTIEAACKLRYQKCLDAHRLIQEKKNSEARANKGLATAIRSVLGSFTRLTKSSDT